MIPAVETYRQAFKKTAPVGAQYRHFEEGQRIVSRYRGEDLRSTAVYGIILRFWSFDGCQYATIRTDSGGEHSLFLSDVQLETPLETLARAAETP